MRAVIQRVQSASVIIENEIYASINKGLLVLLGIIEGDDENDIKWLANKIVNMRIFGDSEGKMNFSLNDNYGSLMIVSQFTLFASTKKGNRPSFTSAANPEIAIPLYDKFIEHCRETTDLDVQTGSFGADMKLDIINDGPVTIIIDSKLKE